MSLFDQASLVVTPNGFKAGKLYSIKPVTGAGDLDVVRATSATRVNANGLIESVGNNIPRLDYPPLGGCPSILVEPQATNLVLRSEEFDDAYWTKSSLTVTANAAISPDGYANADTILSTDASPQLLSSVITFEAATNVSVFVKYVSQRFVQLFSGGAFGDFANFDIQNETLGTSGASTSNAKIENYGNGWLRISATFSGFAGATTARLGFTSASNAGWNSLDTAFNKSVLAYGFQLEAGSYATSYIPTVASAVTRNADVINKTGVSSLIGQTEGTIYAEVAFPDTTSIGSSSYYYISDGSFSNSVIIGRNPASPTPKYLFYINASGSNVLSNAANDIQSGFAKLAIGYKSGSWAAYLNGTLVASGTDSLTFGTMSRIAIGTNDGAQTSVGSSMIAKQAALFPNRLSNAQLASLTTL